MVAAENDSDSSSEFSSTSSIPNADFLGQKGLSKSDRGKLASQQAALAGVKRDSSEDMEEETEAIRQSIAKRNVREGKELLKKTSKVKGKDKAKADMGGGSFQSMGSYLSAKGSY
jgi:ATP-dependent RNA helicase DDX54/DBP10